VELLLSFYYELRIKYARWKNPHRRNARFVVLLGGPGAGKGTLAAALAPRLGIPHLNMGNIIRREIKEQTDIGRVWGPKVKNGKLIPDKVVNELLRRELLKPEYAGGAVLDGIPRTAAQARKIRALLAAIGSRVEAAVLLDVTKEDLLERLALRRTCTNSACARTYHLKFIPPKTENTCDACGSPLMQRDDEKPEAIVTRMEEFNRTFAPLRAHYQKLDELTVVRSTNEMGPDKVLSEVLFALEETI
jgi:adenylate kinase